MNSATRAARTSVFILIMLSPSLECAAAQTTIVVLRTSTEIVAGSDSKERLPNGDSVVGCKVERIGNLFWSVSGFRMDNYKEIISFAHQPSASIRKTVEKFSVIAPPVLQKLFDNLRLSSPADYKLLAQKADREGISITFFGMENQIPIVINVPLFTKLNEDHRVVVSLGEIKYHDTPVCSLHNNICGVATGFYETISPIVAKYGWGSDLVPSVRQFIQMEIDAQPADVGPPIRILKIDNKGPRWVQNGDGCEQRAGDIPNE